MEPTVTPRPTNTPTPTITPTPLANLTMGTLTRAPTCSKVGNSMTFSGVITNNGAGGTGVGFKARLEIDYNQDGTYDFTAPLNSVSALNSMASTTTTFTNAWTAIVGDHRFRICADKPDNDVTETDETIADNCQSQNFSVTELQNLITTNLLPNSCTVGQQITFSGVITNNGIGATCSGFDSRLQIDENFSGSFTPDQTNMNSVIPLNGGGGSTTTFSNAWTAVGGTTRYRICADEPNNDIEETNETLADNCATKEIICVTPTPILPNLTVSNMSKTPDPTYEGDSMTFLSTITNNGSATTGGPFNRRLQIDLNNDGTWNFENNNPTGVGLGAGNTMPGNFASIWTAVAGTHRARICVDLPDNVINETDETVNDNCEDLVFTVNSLPNLTVGSLSRTPSPAYIGEVMDFSAVITNNGNAGTGAAFNRRLEIDIGRNGTWDVTVNSPSGVGLAASGTMNVTFNNAWAAVIGDHQFRICADMPPDPGGAIRETIDTIADNCDIQNFTVYYPDLTIGTMLIGPVSPKEGDTISFSADVLNQGTGGTRNPFNMRLQLDINYDAGTGFVASAPNPYQDWGTGALAAATTRTILFSNTWTAVSGTHAIRVCADLPDNVIVENNENNNCDILPFTVASLPNLTVGSLSRTPAPACLGEVMDFSAVITNNGNAGTGATFNRRLQIDVGRDGTWDVTVNSQSGVALGAGGTMNVTFNNAWNPVEGDHQFRICADMPPDPGGAIRETIDTIADNCEAQNFSVYATDLTISSTSCTPNPAVVGNSVSFSGTVLNQGTCGTQNPFNMRLQLDKNYTGSFVADAPNPYENYSTGALGAGVSRIINFTTPWTAEAGTHAIRVCADLPDNVIVESDENNNCTISSCIVNTPTPTVTLTPTPTNTPTQTPQPDLFIPSLSCNPNPATVGDTMSFTGDVQNIGGSSTINPFNMRLQLDKDYNGSFVADAPDPYENYGTAALPVGFPRTISFLNSWVATTQTTGNLGVRVCADLPANAIPESNEANNCGVISCPVYTPTPTRTPTPTVTPTPVPTFPDLIVSSTSYTPGTVYKGDLMSFSAVGYNQGDTGSGAGFNVSLKIDGNLISNYAASSLASKTSANYTDRWTWSTTNTTLGNHSYEICMDSGNTISESNE